MHIHRQSATLKPEEAEVIKEVGNAQNNQTMYFQSATELIMNKETSKKSS